LDHPALGGLRHGAGPHPWPVAPWARVRQGQGLGARAACLRAIGNKKQPRLAASSPDFSATSGLNCFHIYFHFASVAAAAVERATDLVRERGFQACAMNLPRQARWPCKRGQELICRGLARWPHGSGLLHVALRRCQLLCRLSWLPTTPGIFQAPGVQRSCCPIRRPIRRPRTP
jgi:hypothetical protein